MFNKKRSSQGTSFSNEGYSGDKFDHSNSDIMLTDVDLSPTRRDLDELMTDLEQMEEKTSFNSAGATRNISVSHALEGIQEEIGQDGSSEMSSQEKKSAFQNKENSEMNRGTRPDVNKINLERAKTEYNINMKGLQYFKNNIKFSTSNVRDSIMSLSNFKKINMGFVPDEGIDNSEQMRRDVSYGSIIQMKDIPSEVHTGRRFRRCSALVITPKVSDAMNPYDSNEDHLNIRVIDDSITPPLFIELDMLYVNPISNSYCWIEKSRWLRYEEDYDIDLKRFHSPHLSAMSMRGLTSFRKFFKKGDVILNCENDKYIDVLKMVSETISKSGTFDIQEIADARNALGLKHFHAGEHLTSAPSESSMFRYDHDKQCFQVNDGGQHITNRKWSMASIYDGSQRKLSRARIIDRLDPHTESLSVQVGALDSFKNIFSLFIRFDPPLRTEGINEVNCPIRFIYLLFGPKSVEDELIEVGRAFSIMMSNPGFREVGYAAETKEEILDASKSFLQQSVIVPLTKIVTNDSVNAMIPHLKQYSHFFHSEQNKKTFEEFKKEIHNKNQEIVLNQYNNGVNRKISVNTNAINQSSLTDGLDKSHLAIIKESADRDRKSLSCKQLCFQFLPPFKQMFLDFKGIKERYLSDYTDAFIPENVPIVFIGMIFIYFVVLSPAITFGALFNQLISPKMSVSMCLVSSGFFQLIYTLVSGQPLEVVGITGPLYVVEKVLGSLSSSLKIELEVMRFWIGIYVSILGFVFCMFNGVIVMKHFRRSVEEVFNFFVGIIFILSALFTMFKALPYSYTPVNGTYTNFSAVDNERFKFARGGTTLFMAFLMLNFCLMLVQIKRGSYFRRQIRNLLGSFNVPLGIILIVAIERIFFGAFKMPTLNVPPSNQFNATAWINPPNFASVATASTQAHLYCFAISLSLFFIIIVEVSTNSISVTKAERKLAKSSMFSINYFIILVVFPIISAFLGWPYVSGAMVRSNAHCIAMAKWSLNNLPGVSPKVIGAAEQRVSGVIVGSLVLLSVFLGSALRYIPMAAMYGMFLYMGVMGVRDLQVTKRVKNLFQRRKYWHQHDFFNFPSFNIIILVSIQLFFISILIILNVLSDFTKHSWTPLIFPFFVGLYAFIRGYVLPCWPRLNTHLSKMDKKHQVKLYDGKKPAEQIIIIKDDSGVNMVVVPGNKNEDEEDSSSECERESEMDKELW